MNGEAILARLRGSGYRLTAPRRTLVAILLQAEAPLTADEICRRTRRARAEVDLSTVYRNLAAFCEMGWLDAVPGANGERYYQVRRAEEQSMSVVCLDCGQVTPLAAQSGPLNEAVRGMGFDAATLRVTVAAHCSHVCPNKPARRQ